MLGFKSKSASTEQTYVVVHHVPAAEPPTQVGPAWDRDAAMRIFDGVLRSAPAGFFHPHSGASVRVVATADWNQARLVEALIES